MEQHTLLQREESPRSPAAPSLRRLGGSRHITHWDPEDLGAWEAGNKGIARRNLLWSVVTVHLGYSVWTLWPVLELLMPQDVYGFSTSGVCGPDRLRRRQLRVVNEQRQCFLSTSAQGFGARNCRWGRQSRGAGDPASWVVGNRHCR